MGQSTVPSAINAVAGPVAGTAFRCPGTRHNTQQCFCFRRELLAIPPAMRWGVGEQCDVTTVAALLLFPHGGTDA